MDWKALELYNEEQRAILNETLDAIKELKPVLDNIKEQYKEPPTDMNIEGEVTVKNPVEKVEVDRLTDIEKWLEVLEVGLVKAIKDNSHKPLDTIKVSNINDAKSEIVAIKNFNDLEKLFKKYQSIVNVEKQEVVFPTSATKPISVRLSDGKSFYMAQSTAVAGGMVEVDPLVGYQPADEDKSTDPVYYGFTRKNGAWYIMENNKANGTYRYAIGSPLPNGGGLYSDAWTNRANLTYDYFHEVF